MLAKRYPIQWINKRGIALLPTIGVSVDTTAETVTLQLCPWRWKQLCKEGLFLLRLANEIPTSAATFAVQISTKSNITSTFVSNNPLLNGNGDAVVGSELSNGNYYLVYYNKCSGMFQLVNYIPTAAPATTNE